MLIDSPKAVNTRPVMTIDSGMAVSVMNVVRKFSRNRNRMTTTRMPPSRKASQHVGDGQVDERPLLIQLGMQANVLLAVASAGPAERR